MLLRVLIMIRFSLVTLLAILLLWVGPQLVFAQGQAPASPAAPGGVTTVQTQTYWLEYGLVLIMFGIALYAVCRTSRRN